MNLINIFFIFLINTIWIIGFYFLIKKISNYRKRRILIPNRNLSFYLKPIDEVKDAKTRRNWLVSFILFNFISCITSSYMILILDDINLKSKILVPIITLFFFSISILVTYYCAYLKKGTALLLWILITIPFSQLSNSFLQASKKISFLTPNWLRIILLTFTIFYWIQSLLLRNANLRQRYHNDAIYLKNYFESMN